MHEIAIIGAGGLGTPAAWGICEAWVEPFPPLKLHIIDYDRIELSNLNRQVLFSASICGQEKAAALSAELGKIVLESGAKIGLQHTSAALDSHNIDSLLSSADFVIDATDSIEAKFLINDFCVRRAKGFCYGGVAGDRGLLFYYDPELRNSACLRCLFGEFSDEQISHQTENCQQSGILGATAGYLGFLQAECAIQYFQNSRSPDFALKPSTLYRIDAKSDGLLATVVQSDPNCPLEHKEKENVLDLSDKKCPETFLYTKLALEKLLPLDSLSVIYGSAESAENVAQSMPEEGFRVVDRQKLGRESWRVIFSRERKPENA